MEVRKRGRPKLDNRVVNLSVHAPTHDAVIAQAGREGRTISAVYQRAVQAYLRSVERKSDRGAAAPR